MATIDAAVADFYNKSEEDSRLQLGLGPLEFERNKNLIGRYLPKNKKLIIADVGGGPGHYAKWLSAQGHEVILIDPVEKHIRQAKQKVKSSKTTFEALLGEARDLPIKDKSADLVILHGPLYHLPHLDDRLKALTEAKRILNPGGIVLGFAITHSASTVAALLAGMIYKPEIWQMCLNELNTGAHEPPAAMPGMLAQGFFHKPSVLLQEFHAAGFMPKKTFAVEGMAWLDGSFFVNWADQKKRERMLELISLTESDPELLCFSPHIMVAAGVE
ncbi:MAG TPA: class I SAM-dependent methyltransferase [Mucilaginibacter sp.]